MKLRWKDNLRVQNDLDSFLSLTPYMSGEDDTCDLTSFGNAVCECVRLSAADCSNVDLFESIDFRQHG